MAAALAVSGTSLVVKCKSAGYDGGGLGLGSAVRRPRRRGGSSCPRCGGEVGTFPGPVRGSTRSQPTLASSVPPTAPAPDCRTRSAAGCADPWRIRHATAPLTTERSPHIPVGGMGQPAADLNQAPVPRRRRSLLFTTRDVPLTADLRQPLRRPGFELHRAPTHLNQRMSRKCGVGSRIVPQIRISEAAHLLGVSDDTVRRWSDAGPVADHEGRVWPARRRWRRPRCAGA